MTESDHVTWPLCLDRCSVVVVLFKIKLIAAVPLDV